MPNQNTLHNRRRRNRYTFFQTIFARWSPMWTMSISTFNSGRVRAFLARRGRLYYN